MIKDLTMMESSKREVQMSSLGVKGFWPAAASLKEVDLATAYRFKKGNDNGGRLDILRKALGKMPRGKKIQEVFLDAEYYTTAV